MEARRIQLATRAGQPQLLHHAGCQQVIKWLHAERENGIQGSPHHVVVQHLGGDARPQQPFQRLAIEKIRRQVQGPLHKAQADQNHRLDCHSDGDMPLVEVLGDHGINPTDQAQFIDHTRHQAMMVERVTRVVVRIGCTRKFGG
jgi:hypothetical protein